MSFKWSKEVHKYFPPSFRLTVFTFFLAMRRKNNEEKTISKIPKVLLIEITRTLSELMYPHR